MKKLIIPFLALFLFSVALISWKNYNQKKSSNGAVVINNFGCGMLDGSGEFVFTERSHAVITSSGNGQLRCQAKVPNPTGKAVLYKDLPCGTFAGFTLGHETVSASGQATLICNVNNQ